ncbi:MAG: tRNA (adenosine(37)-N6)-dimethylallyltransferase MiaA [Planctomycetota bacterium]|jgi:tRNA dimethylallyltransferase
MHKLYFILGCTGCGKAAVGQELARRLGGEILSVDSMKIYRRMDIGTAKPSAEVRAEIPHHGIDLVEPSEGFSVAQYVDCADQAIQAIHAAGAISLAVGGTSLYIMALSQGLFEGPSADPALREQLKARAAYEGPDALHRELSAVDPAAADRIHPNDERRIVRALEVFHTTGRLISKLQQQWDAPQQRYDCVFVGLRRDKADQSGRINRRVGRMIDAGLKDEVAVLLAEPDGLSDQASAAVGYAEWLAHFRGELTEDQAVERIKINTRRLAKKQRTWQRRFANVQWFDLAEDDTPAGVADCILSSISFDTP